ncbi:MAG: Asp-tRNA(Asn)/Glu-tRNA(Gln) amidotransferase GatCAB subunit A [Rhodobacteraceae bacterium]|nr:Asp-tRNA(Asn)/Glu-tRNA(Gln) amidotransferase GatCAB subunit A [Paracoccaceae bacterium]MAY45982.1 Asp-tRNA(Asn)/Glu-tRNA(Gln) amidotransferase GatCAB subunit A [Paracoccaceae bacterium]
MSDIAFQPLTVVAAKIKSGAISPVEVTEAVLSQVEKLNSRLTAYWTVTADLAREQAKQAEAEIAAGRYRGPLHGIPMAVKDLCFTKGIKTTGGMKIYEDFVPDHDATVVVNLRNAGAVLIGKLHMTEGATLEHHPDFTEPVNPWKEDLWTGVSSSGSGIAPATGMAYCTIGSDTGGSIRFPSACNNLTGVKPTWGRVSRYGIFDLAETFDHLGPMARSAADAAAMLEVLAGHDPLDPTSLNEPVPDYLGLLDGAFGARGVTIGIPRDYIEKDADPETVACLMAAVKELEGVGARGMDCGFPDVDTFLDKAMSLTMIEMAAVHADTYPKQSNMYGQWIREGIEAGMAANPIDVANGVIERKKFTGALTDLLDGVDMIAIPVFQYGTPTWDEVRAQQEGGSRALFRFTSPFNASGVPSVTLPCGMTADGRPIAFQLIGTYGTEAKLLRTAHAYQQVTDWHTAKPPVH